MDKGDPKERDLSVDTSPKPTGGRGFGGGRGPAVVVTKARDFGGSVRRLSGLLLEHASSILWILLLTALSVTSSVLGPWLLGLATDSVVAGILAPGGIDFGRLLRLLGIAASLQVIGSLASWRQSWVTTTVVQTMGHKLRRLAEEKLSRLPLAWFDRQPRGEVLSRVTNDIDNINQSLQQILSQLFSSILQIVGVLAIMVWLSPLLALTAVVVLVVSLLLATLLAKTSQPHFVQQWTRTGTLNSVIEETFTGHTLVKVFGHQQATLDEFETENGLLFRHSFLARFLSGVMQPATMFVGNLGVVAVLLVGAFRVMAGSLTIGMLQAFIQYMRQISQPMAQVSSIATILQSAVASAERVFELLDAPEFIPDPTDPKTVPEPRGHVLFDHVSFRYVPDRPLFEDVSLEVQPGQTVAIVGPTGAGKTTLVNLLMRFYEVDSGRILLDGVDIAGMRRDDLRSHFGMVLQNTWLFSGTIRDNLAYGRNDATEEQIIEAAVACHVDHFVRTLPAGYDTVLDENGSILSTGQRQLLTIARAFLTRPTVLILDEATSSVDTRTEVQIQQAMARLRQDRTSFVIAHRLSTIRDADTIVYMENGNVLEQGTHDQLLALNGSYARLYLSQWSGATEDA